MHQQEQQQKKSPALAWIRTRDHAHVSLDHLAEEGKLCTQPNDKLSYSVSRDLSYVIN
jgi:hypothetical protein